MREDLLQVLAEPTTGASLSLAVTQGKGDSIETGTLTSTQTGKVFPIVGGIPRFVDSENYASSFGRQWNAFRAVQIDSQNGYAQSQYRFETETGWSDDEIKGKWMLDGGCGAGRFAEIAAKKGARIVGLDISSAVDACKKTVADYPLADVVQGSLLDPPFKKASFDFAYSIGVMQHTPDPKTAVRRFLECVKPLGRFTLTIYRRGPFTKLHSKYLVRPLTKRLPQEALLKGIEMAMPVVFPVTEKLFSIPVASKLFRFMIPVANYVERTDMTREDRYQEAVLDTFDMLSPAYDLPMTAQEVESVLRDLKAHSWSIPKDSALLVRGEA